MIKKLKNVFDKDVSVMRDVHSPMGPGMTVTRPSEEERKA
jgi:hypothetical protein